MKSAIKTLATIVIYRKQLEGFTGVSNLGKFQPGKGRADYYFALSEQACYNSSTQLYSQEALSAARNRERPDTRRSNARVAHTAQKTQPSFVLFFFRQRRT